jgi:hypothetical protein
MRNKIISQAKQTVSYQKEKKKKKKKNIVDHFFVANNAIV